MYYAALDAKTCLAELFQGTRCIDRTFQSPWLVIFETAGSLKLLDLNGGAPALALNDRALLAKVLASQPLVHRALADDILLDPLKHAASSLRYALC